jgi:hypothetical protein
MTTPPIDEVAARAADDFTRTAEQLREENPSDETTRDLLLEQMADTLTTLLEVTETIRDSNERQFVALTEVIDKTLQNLNDQERDKTWAKVALRVGVAGGITAGIAGLISIGKDIFSFRQYLESQVAAYPEMGQEVANKYEVVNWKTLRSGRSLIIKPNKNPGKETLAVFYGNATVEVENLIKMPAFDERKNPYTDYVITLVCTGLDTKLSVKRDMRYITASVSGLRRICEVLLVAAADIQSKVGGMYSVDSKERRYHNLAIFNIANGKAVPSWAAILGSQPIDDIEKLVREKIQQSSTD